MYALLAVAIWRVLIEKSATIARTRSGYWVIAVVVLTALLYPGEDRWLAGLRSRGWNQRDEARADE